MAPKIRSWVHSVKPLGDFPSAARGDAHPPSDSAPTLPTPLETFSDSSGDKSGPLARALALLFEPSPILYDALVPALAASIRSTSTPPILSYTHLIDTAITTIAAWPDAQQAAFVAAHPRIGEIAGLSALSAQEQAARATPPEVLARLAHLNRLYESVYPGLVYITFVNGRSREEIKDEMEDKLGIEHSTSPDEPSSNSLASVEEATERWTGELRRAVVDVGKIAKARLRALGEAEEAQGA
ncbi:OHCU decarboxylase-domain-containing protein [Epithele typhae]|uniref:OHCU decarboxylase-domain-containing protein n=1 Tax=Epithele typhae TaxID=378194 RepID=UPI0020075CE4|nr:OHCU decarboxylase-domain-containing protein [Epithele typhae]KAH9935904.1 OHCU decarboxylase-domain-containing protein [Epithele typhae]